MNNRSMGHGSVGRIGRMGHFLNGLHGSWFQWPLTHDPCRYFLIYTVKLTYRYQKSKNASLIEPDSNDAEMLSVIKKILTVLTAKYWTRLTMLHFGATFLDPSLKHFRLVGRLVG